MSEVTITDFGNGVTIVEDTAKNGKVTYGVRTPHTSSHDKGGRWWESPEAAELYAHVYIAVDGFREEKTNRRGIPPAVALAGKPEVVSYMLTLPGYSRVWFRRNGYERETVNTYTSRVRKKARERLEEITELEDFEEPGRKPE